MGSHEIGGSSTFIFISAGFYHIEPSYSYKVHWVARSICWANGHTSLLDDCVLQMSEDEHILHMSEDDILMQSFSSCRWHGCGCRWWRVLLMSNLIHPTEQDISHVFILLGLVRLSKRWTTRQGSAGPHSTRPAPRMSELSSHPSKI